VTDQEARLATRRAMRRWLWDHSGRISGIALGLFAAAFLVLLGLAGYSPAYGLLVVIVVGLLLVILGGKVSKR
jgi:hypothetical protein